MRNRSHNAWPTARRLWVARRLAARAWGLRRAGEPHAALEMYRQAFEAMAVTDWTAGGLDVHAAAWVVQLHDAAGTLAREQGCLDEAHSHFIAALALMRRNRMGKSHIRVMVSNIGGIRYRQGRLSGARAAFAKALSLAGGPETESTEVAGLLSNLAAVHEAAGELSDAERLLRRAL